MPSSVMERVEVEALAGEGGLGLLRDPLRERRTVTDDLLHRHRSDDRAERTGEHLLREGLDLVLLGEEALARGADLVLVAADLDDRDAVEVELDALARHRTTDCDRDAPAGEVEDVEALYERHDERAAAHDDPLAGEVLGHDPGAVGELFAAGAGDDEGLVGAGDLVARDDDDRQQHDDGDQTEDRKGKTGHNCSLVLKFGDYL